MSLFFKKLNRYYDIKHKKISSFVKLFSTPSWLTPSRGNALTVRSIRDEGLFFALLAIIHVDCNHSPKHSPVVNAVFSL